MENAFATLGLLRGCPHPRLDSDAGTEMNKQRKNGAMKEILAARWQDGFEHVCGHASLSSAIHHLGHGGRALRMCLGSAFGYPMFVLW